MPLSCEESLSISQPGSKWQSKQERKAVPCYGLLKSDLSLDLSSQLPGLEEGFEIQEDAGVIALAF
jgi:hypothetical protein